MSKKREAGILMPVSSLPSSHGIGDLGPLAYEFADHISGMGFKIWQILPLNPLGFGNSPYQPYSSFGGDPIYISLDLLAEDGLLDRVPEPFMEDCTKVAYEKVREYKDKYLRKAFLKFSPDESFEEFAEKEWVYPFGVFMMFKNRNKDLCWNEWKDEEKNWPKTQAYEFTAEEEEEIQYQMFLQYLFYTQWMELKNYVNHLEIKIMGDIPFYVGLDSLDVWMHPECFLLNTDGVPVFIAGVPPDYFSPTGQRWGNPIYDWEHLKETSYDFWIERVGYNGELFDIIRIDHFRAFDTYWKIPASCPTAIEGEWVEAPGYEVFDLLLERFPDIELVMEDLGELRPEVGILRDHYNFKGMRVYQFSMDIDQEEDKEQLIVYTGTHDNQTVRGWFLSQEKEFQERILRLFEEKGYEEELTAHRFIHYVMDSRALMAVVPVQDVLNMDDEGRINTPGTVGSPNWEWHLPDFEKLKEYKGLIADILCKSGRSLASCNGNLNKNVV